MVSLGIFTWFEPGKSGQFDYRSASDLVDIGLDAGCCAAEIELCVAVVAIVRLSREPAIDVVTIAKQKSAGLAGALECAAASGCPSQKNPVPWMLISDRFSCPTPLMTIRA